MGAGVVLVAGRSYMFLHFVVTMRRCWLCGMPGGGKTSLGVATALALVRGGYADTIAINSPLRVGQLVGTTEDVREIQQLRNVAIVFDEAWITFGKGQSPGKIQSWLAYPRHLNQYLLMPSVLELVQSVSAFRIERRWNGLMFGLPFWLYKWYLRTGVGDEKGTYIWWHPQRVFQFYDHTYNPTDEWFIYKFGTGTGPSTGAAVR